MSIGVLRYKYIYVARNMELDEHAGHPIYYIFNLKSREAIGRILYYKPWRRFVATFSEDSVWSTDCLADVELAIAHITEKNTSARTRSRTIRQSCPLA